MVAMAFPFFCLPFKIRHLIYQYLYTPADKHEPITPDIRPFYREFDGEQTTIPKDQSTKELHCRALSMIRTCQQAHEEGTNVLYGQNTFKFSDTPYHNDERYHVYSPPILRRVRLPFCEVAYMYGFLSVIGKANRPKIRHLELVFNSRTFLTFPGEHNIWTGGLEHEQGGASYVSDALDILSENHRLRNLRLSFNGSHGGLAGFSLWFAKESRLAERIAHLKGIEKFRCDIDGADPGDVDLGRRYPRDKAAWYEKAIDDYQELKLKLENGSCSSNGEWTQPLNVKLQI